MRKVMRKANGKAVLLTGNTEILYKVFNCNNPRNNPICLEYICYKGKDSFRTIEVTNFGALLREIDFLLSGLTKNKD